MHFVKSIHLWRQHSIYKKNPLKKRMLTNYSKRGRMLTVIKTRNINKKNYRYHECTYLNIFNSLYLNYKEETKQRGETYFKKKWQYKTTSLKIKRNQSNIKKPARLWLHNGQWCGPRGDRATTCIGINLLMSLPVHRMESGTSAGEGANSFRNGKLMRPCVCVQESKATESLNFYV